MKLIKQIVCAAAVFAAASAVSANGGKEAGFDAKRDITVISREDGSGTRGAFIELFGVEKKNEAGKKVDYTTDEAMITNSTAVMMTSVSGNLYAIGYISLGSLNSTVKALQIDGAAPTVAEILAGRYKIVRPFNVITSSARPLSAAAADFLSFIMSTDGQAVVKKSGYIPMETDAAGKKLAAYTASSATGKVVLAGSSSVTPLMEKLKEAYQLHMPTVIVEVQQSDSTTGVTSTQNGICDIGMASRDLKKAEADAGLLQTVIAQDGIAVIVHNENPVSNVKASVVRDIYTGAAVKWSDCGE